MQELKEHRKVLEEKREFELENTVLLGFSGHSEHVFIKINYLPQFLNQGGRDGDAQSSPREVKPHSGGPGGAYAALSVRQKRRGNAGRRHAVRRHDPPDHHVPESHSGRGPGMNRII